MKTPYCVEVDPASQKISILTDSTVISLEDDPEGPRLRGHVGIQAFDLLQPAEDGAGFVLRTWNGGTFPVFYRSAGHTIRLSNHPIALLTLGETVRLRAQVVVARLSGAGNQLYNLFDSIPKLEASSQYRLTEDGEVHFERSLLAHVEDASYERARELFVARFRAYIAAGDPIAIPLSGGYDSRLNLALTRYLARGGTRISLHHEIKDDDELRIARAAADFFGLPLEVHSRDAFLKQSELLSVDPDMVVLAGANRGNIWRWTAYLHHVRQEYGRSTRIIGFGAEPHKGKYYRKIQDLHRDSQAIFRLDPSMEAAAAAALGIREHVDFHGPYIEDLVARSQELFPDAAGQIDYVHYHTYVVNCYGFRSQYFSEAFGIDFPQFDTDFLNTVMSMRREEKEDYGIIRRMLQEFGDGVDAIDFVSGNVKSLKPPDRLWARSRKAIRRRLRPKHTPRGMSGVRQIDAEPRTNLTDTVARLLTEEHPALRRRDATILWNYLVTLEDRFQIDFELI